MRFFPLFDYNIFSVDEYINAYLTSFDIVSLSFECLLSV